MSCLQSSLSTRYNPSMVKKESFRLCDPSSWPHLAAEASSHNLSPIFVHISLYSSPTSWTDKLLCPDWLCFAHPSNSSLLSLTWERLCRGRLKVNSIFMQWRIDGGRRSRRGRRVQNAYYKSAPGCDPRLLPTDGGAVSEKNSYALHFLEMLPIVVMHLTYFRW